MSGYDGLRRSLRRLEEQYGNWDDSGIGRTRLDREAIRESVIRRFETCYDCLWKVLKRRLIHELGASDAPRSPKPIFRIAAENDLLGAPVRQWFRYADARVATAHDYDGTKGEACVELVPEFLGDAARLYETLTGEPWGTNPGGEPGLALTAAERQAVLEILRRHLPNTTAWVYGSRVDGTARPSSDLDLVVFAAPEEMRRVGDLRDAFDESNLPFRVDLFVWDAVPRSFRENIRRRHVVLVDGNDLPLDAGQHTGSIGTSGSRSEAT